MRFLMPLAILGLLGCETVTVPPQQTGTKILSPNEVIVGDPSALTVQNLESAVQKLMSSMLGNPQFTKAYTAAKKAKGGKSPVVFVGNIENLNQAVTIQDAAIKVRLNAMRDTIRASLYDTGLVDVTDDEARVESDFIVLGDMRHIPDVGGYHTYRLRLAIQSLKTDKVIWEGVQTMVKQ